VQKKILLRIWVSRIAWWRDGMKKSYHIVVNFTAAKKSYDRMATSYLKLYHVWRLHWPHLQRSRATWQRLLWWKLHRSLCHVVRLLCKCGKRSLRHVIRLLCKCDKTSLCHMWRLLCFSFHTSSLNREFQCNVAARFFILSHQMYIYCNYIYQHHC